MKTRIKILLAVLVIATAAVVATTPARLDYMPAAIDKPDLALLSTDRRDDLVPGTEKRLTWHGEEQRTEWSVVALHGFSASRQETAPLAERVADSLGANLFETRFSGHGLAANGLSDVSAEQWLDDVAEALCVGQLIGDKIVVLAVSNGAALALSMLEHPGMEPVDSLIMLAPNFGPADPKALWITRPGGPLLLWLVSGSTRSWQAFNDRQALYWTTSYPTPTVIEVIRVVDRAHETIGSAKAPRVQLIYSPDDKVVSIPLLRAGFERIQSAEKVMVEVAETGTPFAHIVAGDIISPMNTEWIARDIVRFILRQAPAGAAE